MAISPRLDLRQTHSLVMTPQLQQAIKLLQLSNLELASFVETELERNPLLERADADEANGHAGDHTPELALNGKQEQADPAIGSAEAASAEGDSDATDADDGDWVDLESANGVNQTD